MVAEMLLNIEGCYYKPEVSYCLRLDRLKNEQRYGIGSVYAMEDQLVEHEVVVV